jgi:hypothetical protein
MNLKKESKIDGMFRQKLKDFQYEHPEHLWQGIADQLDGNKKSRRGLVFWFSTLLIALTISAGVGAGVYYWYNTKQMRGNEDAPTKSLADGSSTDGATSGDNTSNTVDQHPIESLNAESAQTTENELNTADLKDRNFNSGRTLDRESSLRTTGGERNFEKDMATGTHVEYRNDNQRNDSDDNSDAFGVNVQNEELNSIVKESYKKLGEFDNKDNLSNQGSVLGDEGESREEVSSLSVSMMPSLMTLPNSTKKAKKPNIDGCLVTRPIKLTHYYIDAYYTPELSIRKMDAREQGALAYAEKRSGSERPTMAFSSGVRASYVMPQGLAFRTGFIYSINTEKFNHIKGSVFIEKTIKDENGNIIRIDTVEELEVLEIKNRYTFIDIPIFLGYELEMRDFIMSASLGVGLNIMSTQRGKVYGEDLKSLYDLSNPYLEGGERFYKTRAGVSLLGSFGFNYKLNKNFMLLLEPSVRYYVKDLTTPSYSLSHKYLQTGILVGLRYRIK